MYKLVFILLIGLVGSSLTIATRTVNGHLDENDGKRLPKIFINGLSSNDLQSIYYSTLNVDMTKLGNKEISCKRILELHTESKLNEFEKDFYLIGAHKQLQCTEKLPQTILSNVVSSLKSNLATIQEIYYRLVTNNLLGTKIDENTNAKIVKTLQDLLKTDDSLVGLGYAFNVAPLLGEKAAFVADRVEDAIVQADEVDGKMLQFEGGLSITALVMNGAFRVTNAFNKPNPITAEQAVKFANYFLSRRSVQTQKGAHVLIEALKTLSAAGQIAPISIELIGNGQLQSNSLQLNIAVVDLVGKPLSSPPQNIYGKVLSKKDSSVLAEKVQFIAKSSDKTTYSADLTAFKPARGIYTIEISADTSFKQKLQFKVLGRVKVQLLEIGVAESDSSSSVKKQSVNFPNTLQTTLQADNTQKVILKTVLIDEATSKSITVHQAFVRFYNKEHDQEIIFIAEQDSSKAYKFDMDVGVHGGQFNHKSGIYSVSLIVGDASLSNSFKWHVANVEIKFNIEEKDTKKQPIRSPLPEIIHQFRPPEKRPPRIVSDIFTGLCLTPLVLLFIFWAKLGINVSNFSFAPSTIGFHLGFGGILTLFGVFWWQLNMFQTLRLLIPIAVLTFLCGNRLLRRLYTQRVTKSSGATSSSS